MSFIGIHSLSKSYGSQTLFQNITFSIAQGDRIGLVGPNGSGKTSLLKIIMGEESPDSGSISRQKNLRIGYASQVPEFPPVSVEEALLLEPLPGDPFDLQTRARILLGKAQFADFSQNTSTLSGGWKKRLDIIRALMHEPDLLLLDEPTNHLDLEGIEWLETFLQKEKISYLVVSHDRYFLENVTNKIIELNRCYPQGLFISNGNMSAFTEQRESFLEGQVQQERGLTSVVRQEVEWLRRSPKARTTKSQSRVNQAHQLIEELSTIKSRNKKPKVAIDFTASERETRKLLVANNVSKSFGEIQLFNGVNLTLSPGSRIGIVGKNGTGKTTLLKVLSGMISQDTGTVKYAEDLSLVYFDQHREQLSPNISLREALSPQGDMVNYRGREIHVNGWAQRFLFSKDRLEMPVKCLSGGERARILIARLMLKPADILFLDEPTNDLDITTLEIIEESLNEFAGAVVLISHDRCMMDRVCTQILGLGESNEHQFFADYLQWEEHSKNKTSKKQTRLKSEPKTPKAPAPKKLSYKEQRELEGMEERIYNLENEIEKLETKLKANSDDPSLEIYHALAEAQHTLETTFQRWQELLDKSASS